MLLASSVVLIGEGVEDLARDFFRSSGLPGRSRHREAWLWLFAIVASSLGGSLILSRVITRPLSQLHSMATEVAGGNLNCRMGEASARRGDEIGYLSRSFNRMANTLVKLLDNERRLIRDISHELRSPLGRMKMALAVIDQQSRLGSAAGFRPYWRQLEKDVERMEEMLTQMLDQVRLESSRQTGLVRENFDLAGLVGLSVDEFKFEAGEENKKIEIYSSGDPYFYGHRLILKRGLDNMLKNALRCAPADSTVRVGLRQNDSETVLEVEDQGPGVAEALLEKIFEPFFRADQSREINSGGFGLGLTIVRQTAQIHGGRAGAVNLLDGAGRHLGFKVFMSLPRSRTGPADEAPCNWAL
ncbi:MAG: HAMP domain-containing histidine kinase [Candidatus Adiutrix sp.]|nr:HAMP domain-containing histidine kinase [Candidatus Adiutrix sp.]